MLEMYVSGVSTRKVSKVVEQLCGKSVSKSFISSLTKELDPMVRKVAESIAFSHAVSLYDDRCGLH